MKKIRILLDYRAYPIWLFNEMGDLVHGKVKEENPEQGNGENRYCVLIGRGKL